jgi:transcriptional regulator with XRE-family HTH domain
MEDIRIGRILRALRRRRGWTQRELASRSGLSQQTISLIERGHGSRLSGATMRQVFGALDARWDPTVTWRGGDLDRVLDADHAAIVDEVVRRLTAMRWDVRVEVAYAHYGERGSIDVFAARPELHAVVNVEVKSDLTAIESTLRKADEKDRIVRGYLARERFGFSPRSVGRLLVLPASNTSRRRVRGSSATFAAAFPKRGDDVQSWLRHPAGDLAGILFVSDTNRGGAKRTSGGPKRVRGPRSRSPEREPPPAPTLRRPSSRLSPPRLVVGASTVQLDRL